MSHTLIPWNLMSSGHSLQKRPITFGFGSHVVERPGKLLDTLLAIVIKPPVASFGALFQPSIGVVPATPTFGKRIKQSFRSPNIVQVARKPDKRRILSASTIHCASAWHVWFARHSHSQNRRSCMRSVYDYLSGGIISEYEQGSVSVGACKGLRYP